jgi:HK97 family phage major capsid protein
MANSHSDAQIAQYQKEIEERSAFIEGTTANARDGERDLTPTELELIKDSQKRIEAVEEQLKVLENAQGVQMRARQRADDLQRAMSNMRSQVDKGEVEYRSAGAWMSDQIQAHNGNREALQRLEIYTRAAAHQKTTDNAGVVPDPILGPVIDFIDATRPLVSLIGPREIPGGTFYRPRVTQGTVVDLQGAAGVLGTDEKVELDSQKMTITRLTATVKTYGGYVNVSRQNIDFSSPQIMDIVINDLAARYAKKTEAAVGIELTASTTAAVGYGASPTAATVSAAIWTAAGTAWGVTQGEGRVVLAIAPDRLGVFGPLFAPVNPQNAQSTGFLASGFGQGVVGQISGVPVVVSSGLTSGQAFVFSTAAIEVYEQRIGTLQATEPSVLGVQVAYAGYFTTLTIDDDAIIELTAT